MIGSNYTVPIPNGPVVQYTRFNPIEGLPKSYNTAREIAYKLIAYSLGHEISKYQTQQRGFELDRLISNIKLSVDGFIQKQAHHISVKNINDLVVSILSWEKNDLKKIKNDSSNPLTKEKIEQILQAQIDFSYHHTGEFLYALSGMEIYSLEKIVHDIAKILDIPFLDVLNFTQLESFLSIFIEKLYQVVLQKSIWKLPISQKTDNQISNSIVDLEASLDGEKMLRTKHFEKFLKNLETLRNKTHLISALHKLRDLLSSQNEPISASLFSELRRIEQILKSEKPYTALWNTKAVQCKDGTLIFSKHVQQNLDDYLLKKILKSMPEKYRSEVISCNLLPFEATEKSLEIVLKYFPNLDDHILSTIGKSAPDILNAVLPIPQSERQHVFHYAEKLFKMFSARDKAHIIEAIKNLPRNDRKSVVNCILRISKRHILDRHKTVSLIGVLSQLSKEERNNHEGIIEYLSFSSNNSSSLSNITESMERLSLSSLECPVEENSVQQKQNCISWKIHTTESGDEILTFSGYSKKSLNDARLEKILKNIPQEKSNNITMYKLPTIFEVTEKTLEIVIKYLPNLNEESLTAIGNEVIDMWNTIKVIPSKERQHVLENAEKLFFRRIAGEYKLLLIEAIAKVSREDREDVIHYVKTIAQSLMLNALEIERLIQTIGDIPKNIRSNAVFRAIELFNKNIGRHDPINTIRQCLQERNRVRPKS